MRRGRSATRRSLGVLGVVALVGVACGAGARDVTPTPSRTTADSVSVLGESLVDLAAGVTAPGRLDLIGAPVEVALDAVPTRVLGRAVVGGVAVRLSYESADDEYLVVRDDGEVVVPADRITVRAFDELVTVADGALVEDDSEGVAADILADAEPVDLGDAGVAVLAGPTTSYGHAVLGDGVEATDVAIVRGGEVVRRLAADTGRVIEQRRVLATQLDGEPAVVVTTSSPDDGARVEVWTVDGRRRVVGEAIGTGNRWRHVVGVAQLPDGGIEIAEVVTPHLSGTASFLRVDGDRLVPAGSADQAIRSHQIGSRNLAMAGLVDVDGDGRRDLVGPANDTDGIAWVVAGDDEPRQTDAGRVVATNLALVPRPDDRVALVYATTDATLVVHP